MPPLVVTLARCCEAAKAAVRVPQFLSPTPLVYNETWGVLSAIGRNLWDPMGCSNHVITQLIAAIFVDRCCVMMENDAACLTTSRGASQDPLVPNL